MLFVQAVVHAKFHGQHPVVASVINVLFLRFESGVAKVGLQHLLQGTAVRFKVVRSEHGTAQRGRELVHYFGFEFSRKFEK